MGSWFRDRVSWANNVARDKDAVPSLIEEASPERRLQCSSVPGPRLGAPRDSGPHHVVQARTSRPRPAPAPRAASGRGGKRKCGRVCGAGSRRSRGRMDQ